MKRKSTIFFVSLLFCLSGSLLFASTNAGKLYTTAKGLDLNVVSIDSIIQSYDKLNERIAKEAKQAQQDMNKAAAKGQADTYYAAYQRLATLGSYGLDQDGTKTLLARIVAEDEPARKTHATWLYKNSRYYKPTLSLDFSASGDTYNYSFQQQVSVAPGSDVTLPDSSRLAVDSAKLGILTGWGLTKDAVTYKGGQTIQMPYTDQNLYAIWNSGVKFFDPVTKTDILKSDVKEGSDVAVPTLKAPDDSYLFAGWYDPTTGTLLKDEKSYTLKGKGASFQALWRELSVEAVQPLYYAGDKLPTQTQVHVGFSLKNGGSIPLKGLQATLKTDSSYVTINDDSLFVRSLPVGFYATNNGWYATNKATAIQGEDNTFSFVISQDAPSGTVIPFTVTFSDNKGNTWSSNISFTVK